MAINKVVYGNDTIIDLTNDTVTPSDVLNSKTFHDKSGTLQVGSATLSIPNFTLIGGSRTAAVSSYTFSQAYDNIFVIVVCEGSTMVSTTFPTGSTHEEVASVAYGAFSGARALRCYDIHNVESGTSFSTQWNTWSMVYVFSY